MNIGNQEITFVIQGPISIMEGRGLKEGVTQKNIQAIRHFFPGSKIIVSTWQGQNATGLDVDQVLLLNDPGQNSVFNDGVEQKLNNNRQLYSSHQGLRAVTTQYAAKVRSDSIISGRGFIELYQQYAHLSRDKNNTYLTSRIVTSSAFFISSHAGKRVYFHKSDLFDFGLTEDLLKVWPEKLIPELKFSKVNGYKSRYPATEQFLCLHWIAQLLDEPLHINTKAGDDAGLGENFWLRLIANNIIVSEPKELGLDVTERFYKRGNKALEYDLKDWLYFSGISKKPLDTKRIYRAYRYYEQALISKIKA